ncbi:MAG: helicase-exonuclease AddAB subunit AddA [Lachnospiraceae bacterium]|nr:helicase-exonuclease AddAB subunit AddA [Lachnospiraceae bacterium]
MPKFTEEQQKVIDVRNRDVLVSAAAGSGKTTVLVERIIQLITDKEHPMDIDHLLVVTFTRAAAREMREKIRCAIEEQAKQNPGDSHLKRQAAYVFHSQITTIDSFCNYLVRNYFYTVGIEPDFRMLDSGEYTLLESEIINDVFEEHYAQKNEGLLHLSDAYGAKNSDVAVSNMVLELANNAMTNPWPFEWLDGLLLPYELSSTQELAASDFIRSIEEETRIMVGEASKLFRPIFEEYASYGSTKDDKAIFGDQALLVNLMEASTFEEYFSILANCKYETLGRISKDSDSFDFHENYKKVRDEYKGIINSLKPYYEESLEDILASMHRQKELIHTLITLTKDFLTLRYQRLEKMNAWDFSDIEHFALEILKDKNTKEPTQVAQELQKYFSEIMVDEYQDSNYLQEEILRTITKESLDQNNYFMVGDVKQSIYRFRQARPEIFSEKYSLFTTEDSIQQKIELDKNFRSRKQVLEATNDVFLKIMKPDVGNVAYNQEVSLKNGADYYPNPEGEEYKTEILLGIRDDDLMDDAEIEDKAELEAVIIANRIRDLMKDFLVYDKDTKEQRKIRYFDIVILLRAGTAAQTFVDVLTGRGIPTFAEKSKGYFQAIEVQKILSFLRILDNPRQDVALVSVMHSKMFSFTNEELAKIRCEYPKDAFHKAVFAYGDAHPEDEKLQNFLSLLLELRSMVEDTPIHVLLQEIYERTGYLTYVYSLPGGESKRGNLYKLIDLAIKFETTSFKGLFRFCNYIDRLQKYESDMGEAELLSEDDDAVRIMTIHHSKGLEFPVVFLAQVSKEHNLMDATSAMILHSSKGIALDEVSLERRTKRKPLFKKYIAQCIKKDTFGEEMRILYVAMTRAKEKLIITGTYKEDSIPDPLEGDVSYAIRTGKKSGYGGWVIPVLRQHPEKYDFKIVSPQELVVDEVEEALLTGSLQQNIYGYKETASEEKLQLLSENLNYQYPYEITYPFKGKYSVSELKHKAMDLNEENDSVEVFPLEKEASLKKESVSQGETSNGEVTIGAQKGTAMHRFMECFDFTLAGEKDGVKNELQRIKEKALMSSEDIDLLDIPKLENFVTSSLAMEMKAAAKENLLLKEQPFVMGDTPVHLLSALYPEMKISDNEDTPLVLVQGIIDAFYIQPEGVVLVDYKTDRISSGKELVDRYREQMDLYQKAIEKSTHKKVIKRVLYSFSLGEEVVL